MLKRTPVLWRPGQFKDYNGWLPDARKNLFSFLASAEVSDPTKLSDGELFACMSEYESLVKIALLYLADYPKDIEGVRLLCQRSVRVALRLFQGIADERAVRIALRILYYIGEKYRTRLLEFLSAKTPCEVHPESAIIIRASDDAQVCTLCELVIET